MSAFGRFLKTVGDTGVQAAMQERAAKIQAQRDATLQQYRNQSQQQGQNFQREIETSRQEARAAESALDRGIQSRQVDAQIAANEATTAYRTQQAQNNANKTALQIGELNLKQQKLIQDGKVAEIEAKLKGVELNTATQMQQAIDIALSDEASPEEQAKAMESLNLLNNGKHIKVVQRFDRFGNPAGWAAFNTQDLTITEVTPEGAIKEVPVPKEEAEEKGWFESLFGGGDEPATEPAGAGPAAGSQAQPDSLDGLAKLVGAGGFTKENPAEPTTQAEFDALPRGAVYKDPDDGVLRAKGAEGQQSAQDPSSGIIQRAQSARGN